MRTKVLWNYISSIFKLLLSGHYFCINLIESTGFSIDYFVEPCVECACFLCVGSPTVAAHDLSLEMFCLLL